MIFVLVTEILDMLGELVWDRIKKKAEWTDDGKYTCALPGEFACITKSFIVSFMISFFDIKKRLKRIILEACACL